MLKDGKFDLRYMFILYFALISMCKVYIFSQKVFRSGVAALLDFDFLGDFHKNLGHSLL